MASREDRLLAVCVESLRHFQSPGDELVAERVVERGAELAREGRSLACSAQIAMALFVLRRAGRDTFRDPSDLLAGLIAHHLEDADFRDACFLLWADALGDVAYGDVLLAAFTERLARSATQSMELSFGLAALSAFLRRRGDDERAHRIARSLAAIIGRNRARSGLFHRSATREGWLRRRIPVANLSCQCYPAYALAEYAAVSGDDDSLAMARRCIERLGPLQGPSGQWWRSYDVPRGAVARRYPVYAVNQDAALPLAAGALRRAGAAQGLEGRIRLGVKWLFGDNELAQSLVDEDRGVIWRGVNESDGRPMMIREMYAYHPARCILAFGADAVAPANRSG